MCECSDTGAAEELQQRINVLCELQTAAQTLRVCSSITHEVLMNFTWFHLSDKHPPPLRRGDGSHSVTANSLLFLLSAAIRGGGGCEIWMLCTNPPCSPHANYTANTPLGSGPPNTFQVASSVFPSLCAEIRAAAAAIAAAFL